MTAVLTDEHSVRAMALAQAVDTKPPDSQSLYARAMLIAGPIRIALAMWREREMTFPAFTRRMNPDEIDMASGTWAAMMERARIAEREGRGA